MLANIGMFIYASHILQKLETSRKYLLRTTSNKKTETLYRRMSRQLSSTSSNDSEMSGPKMRQKNKPSVERLKIIIVKIPKLPNTAHT